MLDALAFLPVDDVANGMNYIRDNIPECGKSQRDLNELVEYSTARMCPELCERYSDRSWSTLYQCYGFVPHYRCTHRLCGMSMKPPSLVRCP